MLFIFLFIVGFLEIAIDPENSEKLLNNAVSRRIVLRRLHFKDRKITAIITLSDFKKLRIAARGTHARAHILSRHGLPFWLERYRSRLGIALGALMFAGILYTLSLFVWSVKVTGNNKISDAEIIAACERIGVRQGILVSDITPAHSQRLLLEMDGLAWASLNTEGSVLTVNVSEIKNELPSKKTPNDLVALTDGRIVKLDLTSGNAVVSVGDYVKKGDLLVSGILEGLERTEFVPSVGVVIAETERTIKVSRPFTQNVKIKTGRHKSRYVLSLFSVDIPLYAGKIDFNYESRKTVKDLILFEEKMPIKLTERRFAEIKTVKRTFDEPEVKEQLLTDAEMQLEKLGKIEYEIKSQEYSRTEKELTLTFVVTAKENIAKFQKILIDGSN